jgi:ubiquinone/menaquinone biosynthesis C-methylase UbiE
MYLSSLTYSGRLQFVRSVLGSRSCSLLDVGNLGDGASFCAILKKDVEANGGEYYGLDSNEALTKKLNFPNQIVGDLHHTSFHDEQFDMIYAGEIIEHTWTPAVMIGECRRILKTGGLLVLDTPNQYSLLSLLQFLFQRKDSMGDNRTLVYYEAKNAFHELEQKGQVLLQPQHKIFFSPAMMKQLLETQGFVLESLGFTAKPRSILHRLLLWLFPHTGSHLCVVARKASVDEAFTDVVSTLS